MEFLTNEHVERLWQYQPFDLSFAQLFAEFVDLRRSDQLKTKALDFVLNAVQTGETRVVLLTGDPGHGKTHLCGQLIQKLDPNVGDVRKLIGDRGSGVEPIATTSSGLHLYVIKDLSELPPETGADRLWEALSVGGRVTVVCANEGRLRHVISTDLVRLAPLQSALEHVLSSGQTTSTGGVRILNLNHQSVAVDGPDALVLQALRSWVVDRRKWTKCDQCAARSECPIFENHRLLASSDAAGDGRRSAFATLLRIAEKTNHVVTIRELLVFLAHSITGGLRCRTVHERVTRRRTGWQWEHMFFQAAFGQLLDDQDVARLSVFRATRLLDPGQRAIRPVDDQLDVERSERDGLFLPQSAQEGGMARSREQQRVGARQRTELYGFLRRRDFFAAAGDPSRVSSSERLGLQHYSEFERLLQAGVPETETVEIRNTVLCGLEAIQGVRRPPSHGSFAIVDPAFTSHRGNASVVACQLQKSRVRLMSQTSWWAASSGNTPDIATVLDWVDRKVHVVLPDAAGHDRSIELDCRQFEIVCRAAKGLVSRSFFQADIRRIAARLALVGANAPRTDEITVMVRGRPSQLVIDTGDVIVATGG